VFIRRTLVPAARAALDPISDDASWL